MKKITSMIKKFFEFSFGLGAIVFCILLYINWDRVPDYGRYNGKGYTTHTTQMSHKLLTQNDQPQSISESIEDFFDVLLDTDWALTDLKTWAYTRVGIY